MKTTQSIFARLVVVATVVATTNAFAADTSMPDGWVTTKAKLSLLTEADLPSSGVSVDTTNGVVTLYGSVPSETAKTKAVAVTRKIKGVRDVRNLLQVVASSQEKFVKVKDDELKTAINDKLKGTTWAKGTDIQLKSVTKGTVYLTGEVPTLWEHFKAVEMVRWTPGVRSVSTNIRVQNEAEYDAPSAPTADKSDASDAMTTGRAKLALMTTADVPAMDINVDTHNGTVTLFGIVNTANAKVAAEKAVRGVDSVKSVKNEIQVVPQEREKHVEKTDDAVAEELKKMFKDSGELKNIDIEVKNGVARLTGDVKNDWERVRAVTLARAATGVKQVKDDLKNK